MSDKKYYWALMFLGQGIFQPLIVRYDNGAHDQVGLILPEGLTREIPVNAELKIINEVDSGDLTRIKKELEVVKYRAGHGVRNF